MALTTHFTIKSAACNTLGSTNALPQNKFIAHGCAMNLLLAEKRLAGFSAGLFGKFQEEVYMRMGNKFTRLVLALVCCVATVSNSMGLAPSGGSGSGKRRQQQR